MRFKIDGVDLTEYVQESSYSMDAEDEYKEWQDGTYTTHHPFERSRVSGKVVLALVGGVTRASYSSVLKLIKEATVDGQLKATVYVQNRCREEELYFHYKIKTKKQRAVNGHTLDIVEIGLEEC